MALLLDAGAFVAVDKRDRRLRALLRVAQQTRLAVRTSAPVVAQVWRNGGRQVNLARVLAGVDVLAFDRDDARRTGELLGVTRGTDVVDAHLALLAEPGDRILTSDRTDVDRLVRARGIDVEVIAV